LLSTLHHHRRCRHHLSLDYSRDNNHSSFPVLCATVQDTHPAFPPQQNGVFIQFISMLTAPFTAYRGNALGYIDWSSRVFRMSYSKAKEEKR